MSHPAARELLIDFLFQCAHHAWQATPTHGLTVEDMMVYRDVDLLPIFSNLICQADWSELSLDAYKAFDNMLLLIRARYADTTQAREVDVPSPPAAGDNTDPASASAAAAVNSGGDASPSPTSQQSPSDTMNEINKISIDAMWNILVTCCHSEVVEKLIKQLRSWYTNASQPSR